MAFTNFLHNLSRQVITVSVRAILMVLWLCLVNVSAQAKEEIRVSVTHFPPFYEVDNAGNVKGLGMDVISALNEIQDTYIFKPVPVSPRRRHQLFKEGRYDMSFFDHLEWGWDKSKVDATNVYLKGGEIFITSKITGRDQSFFSSLKDKSIAGILGYHYQFADFEADPKILKKRFNITLVDSQARIIKLVMSGRVEIGIITETYLHRYFQTNLTASSRILASQKYDQPYNFRTIIRKNTALSVKDMEELMLKIRTNPRFSWIKEKYGINW